jgi:hypothetical protein
MKVTREQTLTQPYVLDANDLLRLCESLQRVTPKLSFEVSCIDQIKREFTNLNDLLGFENPRKKEILALRIMGFSDDVNSRVWLKFDNDQHSNIYVPLQGDEDSILKASDFIDECLSGIKPWYSLVARADFFWVLSIGWFAAGFGVLLAIAILRPTTFREMFSLSGRVIVGPLLVGF